MASPSMLRATVLLALFSHAFAATSATCNNQTRASGDPSGAQLTAFLNSNNTLVNFCTQNSEINSTEGTVSLSSFELSFKNTNASANLAHCSEAFSDIISQCITPDVDGTYGGTWTEDGETYNVTDISYPQPPLIPSLISASSSTSIQGPSSLANPSSTSLTTPSTQSNFSSIVPSTSLTGSLPPSSSVVSLTSSNGSSAPSSSIGPTASSPPTTNSNPSISSILTQTSTFPTPPPNLVISAGGLGLITLGPQTSTESGSFTSKQTGIAGLTANSATTTSTDGHNTILPIWFLSSGIGVIELPGPGIEPGGIIPPPPGFPPLFIGSDGSPTTGGPPEGTKDPQTSSTDDPTSNNPTSPNPTSTSPTSSSSSSSSSSSACNAGCSSCYTYGGDGSTVPADNGGNDNAVKRSQQTPPPSIAGRIPLSHLFDKRADNFDTFNPGTPDSCQLSKNLNIPNYPTPGNLPKKASGGAQMWWVMTETTAPNTCPVLDYNMVSDADVTSQKINPADANTYAKGGDWSRTNPTVNVDHVYELSILKQYFSSRITAANCGDFKAIFDVADTGSPQVPGDTRLQTIWRQLPSNTNPDFAGMDAKINAIKAQAFSNAFSNPSGSANSLGYLYQLAIAIKLTNDPLVSPLFANTNNRIYAALLAMDALIAGNCNSGTIQPDWASSYETWITGLLTSAGTNVNDKVSSVLNNNNQLGPSARVGPGSTTGADGQMTATTNSIGSGVAAFLQAYPTPNSFTFNVGNLVSFPSSSTANIKRQACTKPPPSTSAPLPTSNPPSSVPTSTAPSSAQPSSTTESSLITPPPASSSAPALPSTCPDGCQCIPASQGGCECLCS